MIRLSVSSVKLRVLSSRLGSLLLLFQRSPIVQMLFPEARVLGGAGLGELAKWTVATVAGLGAYDTVAGATTVSEILPTAGSSNVTAAVGSNVNFVVQCTGAPGTPGSWTMTSTQAAGLPSLAGLTHSNSKNSSTDTLSGTPSTAGTYTVTAKAWENSNFSGGSSSKAFTLTVGDAIIASQPASTSINSGSTATLTVTASGSPLTYQWYQGATGVTTTPVGTNSSSFTTPAITSSTNYWVKVTRGTNTATTNTVVANSSTATVTVSVAPVIVTHPVPTTINSGSTTTLTVSASGSPTPTYQWYRGISGDTSNPVSGATSSTFTTPALTSTTTYWSKATNSGGFANSNAATITVIQPATITSQPASSTINSGTSTTLSVSVSGTAPFAYQWYQGTSGVTTSPVGTNAASFTTPALTASTSYWVKVTNNTNPSGAISNTAIITVNQPATISSHPGSVTINNGASTTLSVAATGTAPFTYQWYQGASGVTTTPVGTNSSSFTTPALTASTSYWVKITNAANPSGALSNTANVTVNPILTINSAPASVSIDSGTTTTLSVSASGTAPFSYQWYQGTSNVTTSPVGTNSASFTTPSLTTATNYWVRVSDATGSLNSSTATVSINAVVAPVITSHPASTSINSGNTTTLAVSITGSTSTYQWYLGTSPDTAAPIPGATTNSHTTPALTSDAQYWVRVTNTAGTADSNTATINVVTPPAITEQSASATVIAGSSIYLSVTASGTSPAYQWYSGVPGGSSNPIPGANSSSFSIASINASTSFWVHVSNSAGTSDSQPAVITVVTTPGIASHPQSITISDGASTVLSVTASGGSISYQWYLGTRGDTSQPVSGATSAAFTTPALSQATSYWVRATNLAGSVDSDSATVSVATTVSILTQPGSIAINRGTTTVLSVVAVGSAPFTYQWYLGNSGDTTSPIQDATSNAFTTAALQAQTSYWVRISNVVSHVDSATAVVSLNQVTLTTSGTHGGVSGAGIYDNGTSATLTATPDSGYQFLGWTGDASGLTNPLTVTMDANKSIGASFGQDTGDGDSDGLTNYQELITYDTNPAVADTDGDGLTDGQEVNATHTNPKLTDSNTNGISDSLEDLDGDGLTNLDELNRFSTNPLLADSNSDGLSDTYAAAFVGTAIQPSVGNQVTFNLKNLIASGNTIKLVGKLPKGLTYNATTGLITGTISATAGTYPISVQVLQGKTVLRTLSLPIVVLPFPASLIGSFEALLEDGNSVPIGVCKITITAADTWTATLDSAGAAKRRTAKGTFTLQQGAPVAPITATFAAASPAPAVTVNVSLNGSNPTFYGSYNGGTCRGLKIATGSQLPSSTTLCNLVFDVGTQDGITVPAGLGWMKGNFSNTGAGTFKGLLGDGTAATFSIRLAATGQAVIWAQPYTNKNSYLGGIISLPNFGQATVGTPVTNRVWWTKAADAKSLSYPAGFAGRLVTVGSSKWAVPASATALGASLGWTNNRTSTVDIAGADLSNSAPQVTTALLPTEFTIDDQYKLAASAPSGSTLVAWTGTATAADGGFSGTLVIPSGFSSNLLTGNAAASGILLQDDAWGTTSGVGLIKVPVSGIKGSFRTASMILKQ